MTMRHLQLFLATMVLAACAPKNYTPYWAEPDGAYNRGDDRDAFTLQRTACHGVCPVYTVRVSEQDVLVFEGERFVMEEGGAISKRLPEGSFKDLMKIAAAYDFASFDEAYPNDEGSNCARQVTDMPSVIISYEANKLTHAVNFYQGCLGIEERQRFDEMTAAIDAVLDIDDWVGPREHFNAKEE